MFHVSFSMIRCSSFRGEERIYVQQVYAGWGTEYVRNFRNVLLKLPCHSTID